MFFDTHCHLNFSRFKKNAEDVIAAAYNAGVTHITVPGTDVPRSQGAVAIASTHEHIYAAVGIHPHHVYEHTLANGPSRIEEDLKSIEALLQSDKVVAVGEIGMDRHVYEQTKYGEYAVDDRFIALQRDLFVKQVRFAIVYGKSLIIHNREAKADLLPLLHDAWDAALEGRSVFHCCEPDPELLEFARLHHMMIGVDGDVTYNEQKQQFVATIPEDMLVLETDSPFLLPEPFRTNRDFPNRPALIPVIAEFIAKIRNVPVEQLAESTSRNAMQLFQVS